MSEIESIKERMRIEESANFPNGNLWNELADSLQELERKPNVFELVSSILRSPIDGNFEHTRKQ